MDQGMASAIGGGTCAGNWALAKIAHVATKWPLINLSALSAGKWETRVLEFYNRGHGLSAHIFYGILVAKPVRTLDRVVHMPLPIVLAQIAEACGDSALSGNGMAPGRKDFADTGGFKTRLNSTLGGAQASAPGTYNDHIVGMIGEFICSGDAHATFTSTSQELRLTLRIA